VSRVFAGTKHVFLVEAIKGPQILPELPAWWMLSGQWKIRQMYCGSRMWKKWRRTRTRYHDILD
jgi:hypothetical protein